MTAARYGLCAIGNALVDVLTHAEEDFLAREGIVKGAFTIVDEARGAALYAKMSNTVQASGGSAANTVAGYAGLGGKAGFMGKVADDALGEFFRHDMRALGVHFTTVPLAGAMTGRCLIFVTPDAARAMNTLLGATVAFSSADLDADLIGASAMTYLEGYQVGSPVTCQAFFDCVRIARQAGRKMALTLSDVVCVQQHGQAFRDLIEGGIDILFCNEHELMALTETPDVHAAVAAMEGRIPLLVATRSEKGAIIRAAGENPIMIAAEPVAALVDTTGAGDQFAAGFLYGLTQGRDLAACGRMGAIAASEVLSHYGPRPQEPVAKWMAAAGVA